MINPHKHRLLFSLLISFIAFNSSSLSYAESLFQAGVSMTTSLPYAPKSLYGTVRATKIGDIITILIEESTATSSKVSLASKKESSLEDRFSTLLEEILPGKGVVPKSLDSFGGSNEVKNNVDLSRTNTLKDTITAQVVEVLPNGNLVIQGKKSLINVNERQDLIVSGVADPRFINVNGQISSTKIANLQIAVTGRGAVSRGQSDGVMNKLLKVLF